MIPLSFDLSAISVVVAETLKLGVVQNGCVQRAQDLFKKRE